MLGGGTGTTSCTSLFEDELNLPIFVPPGAGAPISRRYRIATLPVATAKFGWAADPTEPGRMSRPEEAKSMSFALNVD